MTSEERESSNTNQIKNTQRMEWKTVGIRLKETELAILNQRLKQSGFGSLGELVKAYTQDRISNEQLVEPLAERIAERIVNILLTTQIVPRQGSTARERCKACGRRDLNPGYKLGGLVSYWRF